MAELLDGANLSGVELEDKITFRYVSLRDSNFSDTVLEGADFSNAILKDADFSNANLNDVDLSNAYLWHAELPNADLYKGNLSQASLRDTDFSDAKLLNADFSESYLWDADFSGADLRGACLSDTNLHNADLSESNLRDANLSGTDFSGSNLSNARLWEADLSDTDLESCNLSCADFAGADLSNTNLNHANLVDAGLSGADLTDAYLSNANLCGANLEHTVLVRTNLFNVDLTNTRPHGATFTDVQINDDTEFRTTEQREGDARWWQIGPLLPPQRCGYDPEIFEEKDELETDQLGKAADTYQTFEKLARENARPSLQSEMFILRQDMQQKRYWHNGEYFKWTFARVSRAIFKHGESLGRIFASAIGIILLYSAIYSHFDLIVDSDGGFVDNWVDAVYFSTLTFTTLGLGDFQPFPASELARGLVTFQAALGAILIAIFVFVLGRRAAK